MPRIAYLFSKFPTLSTTLVQHQVKATLELGLDAILVATRTPIERGYHPQDEALYQKTFYLNRINFLAYLYANLKILFRSPLKYIKAIKLALTLKDNFPWQRLKNLFHLAGSSGLADYLITRRVVHVHVHYAFGAADIAIFLEKLTGISYSLSIHGSDVLLPWPLTEEKLKRAAFIISNCRFHINYLKQRFSSVKRQRFYIVPGGIDSQKGLWAKTQAITGGSSLRILNVARLEAVKAQDFLIKTCAELRENGIDFQCRIVGDGSLRKELESLILKLDLKNFVHLLGSCCQNEVAKLYDWANVVVLSSISEGTPMTVIESMAKARPVIAPRITALPELVSDGKSGILFEPESTKDLTAKLISLAREPELRKKMGLSGRHIAEEIFDNLKNAKKLVAIFDAELPIANNENIVDANKVFDYIEK